MEDQIIKDPDLKVQSERKIKERIYYQRSIYARILIMSAFGGAIIFALVTFLLEPIAESLSLARNDYDLIKGGGQFSSVVIISYSVIQFYLEFGSIQIRPISMGPVRLRATSPSGPLEKAAVEQTQLGARAPSEVESGLVTANPAAVLGGNSQPSFDDPTRLASLLVGRLEDEIGAQSRRANANLSLGIVAAVTGLVFLGWLSFLTAEDLIITAARANLNVNAMLYWGSFASKLSLSLAANIFAFFFFASYRRNLSEVRYFHNELTNIQARFVAVGLSNTGGPAELRKIAIKSLIDLERNFVLRKGETTAEIAMRKHDKDDLLALASLISKAGQMPSLADSKTIQDSSRRRGAGK